MNKATCIASAILVIVGHMLIIAGYSFFDEVSFLIAVGLGLILGVQLNIIAILTKKDKDK